MTICPKCGDDLYKEHDRFECECGFKISNKLYKSMFSKRNEEQNQAYLNSL